MIIFLYSDLITGASEGEQILCLRCNRELFGDLPCECVKTSDYGDKSGHSELNTLKCLYQQLVPCSELDVSLVTDWDRVDVRELFEDESHISIAEEKNNEMTTCKENSFPAMTLTDSKTSLRRTGF